MAADVKSTIKLFFDWRFHTLHTRIPTQKLNENVFMYIKHHTIICRWYLLVAILKMTLNTHFLLEFIYFHETIDFSLTSVTSSHVQIWKIVTKIVVGVQVLYNQETTKAIRFIYNLSIF